jgi:hypothetical protein
MSLTDRLGQFFDVFSNRQKAHRLGLQTTDHFARVARANPAALQIHHQYLEPCVSRLTQKYRVAPQC